MRKFQALSLSAALLASLLLGGCANNAASSDAGIVGFGCFRTGSYPGADPRAPGGQPAHRCGRR